LESEPLSGDTLERGANLGGPEGLAPWVAAARSGSLPAEFPAAEHQFAGIGRPGARQLSLDDEVVRAQKETALGSVTKAERLARRVPDVHHEPPGVLVQHLERWAEGSGSGAQ